MKIFLHAILWTLGSLILLTFTSFFLLRNTKSNASEVLGINNKIEANNFYIIPTPILTPILHTAPTHDIRITVLKRFFEEYQSPLSEFADVLVREADINGLDYTIVPAISMQESQGCKRIPENSFNCWGYGIYGSKVLKFSSFPEAIAQVTKTIKISYIKKGYTNATLVEDLWTPSSRGNWSYAVNYFIGKIKEYEKNTPAS